LWINEDYDLPDVSTPAVFDNFLYYTNIQGDIVCVDLKDGTPVWSLETETGFYSSPVVAGKALWTINREGLMTVFKTGKKPQTLFTVEFGEAIDATPAFCGKMIIVRTVAGELIGLKAE
jgi:outer membrane protein assembly factor BamB